MLWDLLLQAATEGKTKSSERNLVYLGRRKTDPKCPAAWLSEILEASKQETYPGSCTSCPATQAPRPQMLLVFAGH